MNINAFNEGFVQTCLAHKVNPKQLLKTAQYNEELVKLHRRPIIKGLASGLPFLFPSRRRVQVMAGDTWPKLSKITGVALEDLLKLNGGGRPLLAGSYVRAR